MKHVRKGAPFLFPFVLFIAAFYFLTPISSEPSSVSEIDALAPVEVVADGFKEPTGVAVDDTGALFVSDRKSGEVFKINGEPQPIASGLKRPLGLAFDSEGRLLIVEEQSGRLLRREAAGSLTVLAEGMKKPRWIAVAEDGVIYITAKGLKSAKDKDDDDEDEEQGEAILRLSTDASLLTIFANGFEGLQGLALGDGVLFAAAKGLKKESKEAGGVFQIPVQPDGTAGQITRFSQTETKKPIGLTVDALGALYVSAEEIELEKKHKDAIGKVAPDGALSRFASKLEEPRGLAFDGSGNLYVADDMGDKKGRVIRLRAPPAPVLTVPPFTNQNPLIVSGSTEPNSRIDAFLNNAATPTTTSADDGSFSLTLPLTPNAQNQLSLFTTAHSGQGLSSAPAEFTIIHDNIAPLIANLQPANGSFLNNPSPLIRADFSDNLSGVDVGKVEIRLDGFNVTAQASVTSSGFTLNLSNCLNVLNCPLSEGSHIVSVTIFDLAGNSTSASTTFTVDVTSPLIVNLTPAHGSVVSTATPLISAQFSDTSGINVASVRIFLDNADVTSLASISASGFSLDLSNPSTLKLLNPLTQGFHTVSVSLSDLAGNPASASSTFTVSLGPKLNPIGNKLVNVGSTLSFTVKATNAGGGPVAFSVAPLPLPANAAFNAITGLFTFKPDLNQVGFFQLTFTASSNGQSDSETITISVPAPVFGATSLSGRLLDANAFEFGQTVPVVGATVSILGTGSSAQSDASGNFTITSIPSGSLIFDINAAAAQAAPDGSFYAGFREDIHLIAGVNNVIDRPFFLPRIASSSVATVNPNFFTTVKNPEMGITLNVAPNTAKNPDGTNFTGQLSISEVPRNLAPAALPSFLDPGLLITIQPVGVTFATPVPITFPNIDNLPPGSQVDIWSLNAELGVFEVVGTGLVSSDGTKIQTISGGVRAADWHFTLPVAILQALKKILGGIGPILRAPFASRCNCTSSVEVKDGSLEVDFSLPTYRSLGASRSLRFAYNTQWASPKPLIPFEPTIEVRSAVPPTLSYKLSVAGVDQGAETFLSTSGLDESKDETIRSSVSFGASAFTTGLYPFTLRATSNFISSRVSSDINDELLLRNESKSPFGTGWALNGVERVFTNFDGSLSVITQEGSLILYIPDSPISANFFPVAGDFTSIVKNPDGTFARTLKNGTKIHFNTQGLETSLVDRNGNATSYSYDGQNRLLSITDPAGLVTTFAYTGNLLGSITDPAGRVTTFQHDAQGNLTKVTSPDGTFKSFGYDANHLMTSETDESGFVAQRQYDSLGRFVSGTRRDGTSAAATNIQSVGFIDPASAFGTKTNPAPVVRPAQALSTTTDGKGNTTSFQVDSFGAITQQTDALGQTTLIDRDLNGLPTKITRPNGAVLTMSYDSRGNLLSSTDPVGGTTVFTYEPNFNQTTSIKAPKGETTAINYDAKGNPTEITDGLGDKTQMAYDARGLLTSVTSAVLTTQQNTTSFTYDVKGNLLTTTDPLGNVTTLEYDSAGNVVKSTDSEGRVTEFTYDLFNRLISVLDPQIRVTRYSYDAKGNLLQVIDTKAQITDFVYDPLDRLVSASNSLGFSESFTYDANGNLVSTTTRNGQLITFDYDALNRLIKKTRPPTSSEIGLQATSFSYDSVGNLTAAINPVIGVFNQYDLANRLISSTSTTEEAVAGTVTQINADTTIDANNFQFDGRTVQVNGRTLTVNGFHTFANLILANGAVLTHSPTTATTVGKLDIRITGILQIDANSKIDVTALGFLGGGKPGNPFLQSFNNSGMTIGFQRGSTNRSGGSYGGLGGPSGEGLSNPVYGDFKNPNDLGSGGAAAFGTAGNGGGLIRIVAQTLQLDGVIKADGESPSVYAGGSGGGIRIDVGALRGLGTITSNGGNGQRDNGGGGGGGRIAIYYQNTTGLDLAKVNAFGGIGNAAPNGGAGTVYLQGPGRENGEVVVDNNSIPAPSLSTPLIPQPLGSLRVRRGAGVRVDALLNLTDALEVSSSSELALAGNRLSASTIAVTGSSIITHLSTTASASFKVDLSANTLTVDTTSRIDATALGFLGGGKPGNPLPRIPFNNAGMTIGFQSGSTGQSGGSYGGLGGSSSGTSNPVYGDFRDPNEPGSGGAALFGDAGNGGGLIRIVAQTLQLDGAIRAGGEIVADCCYGGGSGGGIRIDVGTLRGLGGISANGGNGRRDNGGGGGGGRIAIYYQNAVGFDLTKVNAFGGTGNFAPNGGAGTVYLQGPGRENGELIADNNNVAAPTQSTPILSTPSGLMTLTNLRVKRAARVRIDDQTNLTGALDVSFGAEFISVKRVLASTIDVNNAGVVTHAPTTAAASFKVDLSANTLTVDASSKVDVTALGFLGGGKPGNPFLQAFNNSGMTIGFQRGSTNRSGGSYGGLGGSSGEGFSNPVYGNFRDPNEPGSGGAAAFGDARNGGGLIRIVAQILNLDGMIKADGEPADCCYAGGSGGGIRIDVGTLRGIGQITANGSNGQRDNGGGGGGGRVAVYYQNTLGFDLARITAFGGVGNAAPNGGAGTVYLQGPGRENGELIADNNNVAALTQSTPISATLSGLLALTNLRVKRAARVRIDDQANLTGTLEVSLGGEFIPAKRVTASTIDVNNGALITQLSTTATAFFKVDLSANTVTVDATSRIGVTALGFLGGGKPGNLFGRDGMTVGFQRGSTGRSGGSYGGLGGSSDGASNSVYGDFRDPNEPGSGGAAPFGSGGGNGGGLIRLVAQTLNLDGAIKADGETPEFYGAGSGGGIRIDVGTLSGTGQISASGGTGQPDSGGGGGGGRVAIYYQDALGFDLTRVTVLGGAGSGPPNGQDGTVHLQQQTFIGWAPVEYNAPVMLAESQENKAVQLASLLPNACCLLPADSGPVRIPDFKELIAKLQADLPQSDRPQRRVFSPILETQDSKPETYTNLYLAMVSSLNSNPKSKIENPKPVLSKVEISQDDFDPIYTYDLNGNRTSMIDPTGITNYTYDALNRLTSVTNNKGFTTTFTYDALGRRTSMTHGNGVVTSYSYDAASQLTRLVHQLSATTINSFDYSYDRVGNRTSKTTPQGIHNYTYDTLNRLIEAINPLPTNPLETYQYDAVGNRTNSNQNGTSVFNAANQLTEDANFTYQYDANGNQTRKTNKATGEIITYEYDAENQLVRVVRNGTVVNYKYDGLGRRVEKEINDGATTKTARFVYDNEDILLELDGSNNITARYTHGPGIDEPLIMEKTGASFFYHADGLGSITEITDSAGVIKQRYTYSSFGKIESQLDPTFVQPHTFTAREFDPETGLYHYRERTLDPNTGRFQTVDPVIDPGILSFSPARFSVRRLPGVNPLKHNLYGYVEMNPARFVDPFGLESCPLTSRVCPGGNWSGAGFETGFQFGSLGRRVSSVTLRCWSNPDVTATVDTTCDVIGGGLSADFSGVGLYCFGAQTRAQLSGISEGLAGGGGWGVVSGGGGFTSSKTGATCISTSAGLGAGVFGGAASCQTKVQ